MRTRTKRSGTVAAAALLGFSLAAGTAHAQQFEPNDSPESAFGPLAGAITYAAGIETPNDIDQYYFNVAPQRQFVISLTKLAPENCRPKLTVRDGDGYWVGVAAVAAASPAGSTAQITVSAPAAAQYTAEVEDEPGCAYEFRVDPPGAVVPASPGVVVTLHPADEADDTQRVFLDGVLLGTVRGPGRQSFSLGSLPATSQLTFEAENASGAWSWRPQMTDTVGRLRRPILVEDRSGGFKDRPRVGVVRRVVVRVDGTLLSSCGEAVAAAPCLPVDTDGDGVGVDRDCDDRNPAARPGAMEIPNNAVDEDCDGVAARVPLDRDGDGVLDDRDCDDNDRDVRPGAPEVIGNRTDENCDGVATQRQSYTAKLSLWRRGTSYVGRLTSPGVNCVTRRPVVLRRVATGRRSYGTAVTRRNGTFSIKRSRRLAGPLYAVAPAITTANVACRMSRSGRIPG